MTLCESFFANATAGRLRYDPHTDCRNRPAYIDFCTAMVVIWRGIKEQHLMSCI